MISKIQDALGAAAVMQMADLAVGGTGGSTPAAPVTSGIGIPAVDTAGAEIPAASPTGIAETPAAVVDPHLSTQIQAQQTAEIAKEKTDLAEAKKGAAKKDKPIDENQMTYLMKEINRLMSRMNCNLAFEYHKEVDMMSVRMLEKKTGKLIKEMPPEYMIKGMEKTREWLGTFLDQPA